LEKIVENFEFVYNVAYDTFTHEASGYIISGDYLRTASNDEIILRIYNATGVEVDDDLIDALRTVEETL
jgi:hypothetical protein